MLCGLRSPGVSYEGGGLTYLHIMSEQKVVLRGATNALYVHRREYILKKL